MTAHYPRMPMTGTPARARAHEGFYRLAAAALGHPVPEFLEALTNGSYHRTMGGLWYALTGRPWPGQPASSRDFAELEAGYIDAFHHGNRGQPRIHLVAGDHDSLREGLSRSIFMLNIQAFYRHFGLQAATNDEGRTEEPDHIVTMLEFMAVLHHLEARALQQQRPVDSYLRAQRDFLQHYLLPLAAAVHDGLRQRPDLLLDACVVELVVQLAGRLQDQLAELEIRVGPGAEASAAVPDKPRVLSQNLWG